MNARIAKNPSDQRGLVERAEIRRHNGKVALAVEDLRAGAGQQARLVPPPQGPAASLRSLTELFKDDFNASEKSSLSTRNVQGDRPRRRVSGGAPEIARRGPAPPCHFLYLVAKGKEDQGKLLDAFKYYMDSAN